MDDFDWRSLFVKIVSLRPLLLINDQTLFIQMLSGWKWRNQRHSSAKTQLPDSRLSAEDQHLDEAAQFRRNLSVRKNRARDFREQRADQERRSADADASRVQRDHQHHHDANGWRDGGGRRLRLGVNRRHLVIVRKCLYFCILFLPPFPLGFLLIFEVIHSVLNKSLGNLFRLSSSLFVICLWHWILDPIRSCHWMITWT